MKEDEEREGKTRRKEKKRSLTAIFQKWRESETQYPERKKKEKEEREKGIKQRRGRMSVFFRLRQIMNG